MCDGDVKLLLLTQAVEKKWQLVGFHVCFSVMAMELNLEGVVVGAASLLVIGAFHPLVIWCEYRFTQRIWPVFLIAGLLCLLTALLIQGILSILLGLLGAGCLWSIRELKEQAKRVERGWFPKNPKRK